MYLHINFKLILFFCMLFKFSFIITKNLIFFKMKDKIYNTILKAQIKNIFVVWINLNFLSISFLLLNLHGFYSFLIISLTTDFWKHEYSFWFLVPSSIYCTVIWSLEIFSHQGNKICTCKQTNQNNWIPLKPNFIFKFFTASGLLKQQDHFVVIPLSAGIS